MNRPRTLVAVLILLGSVAAAACTTNDDGRASAWIVYVDASTSGQDATAPAADAAPDATDAADAQALTGCAEENSHADAPPTHLECTGLYADLASKTIANGVREYKPAAVLWSDGADKTRWVYLPPGAKIDTSNQDDWTFPAGTKLWKEFRLNGKRVETRLYAKTGPKQACDAGMCATWVWTTYRWSDDESKAVRLTGGEMNVNGTTYEVPSEQRCDMCHAGKSDKILGFEALSLGLPGATGLTLATLRSEGLLTSPPATDTYAIPEDATGQARAALSWLHVNCGTSCHNTSDYASAGYTGLFMRVRTADLASADGGAARVQDLDTWKTAANQAPRQLNGFANAGYLLIKPGDPGKSLIPTLAGSRNQQGVPQMPPIVSHVVDDAGVGAVNAWIGALGTTSDGGVDGSVDGSADAAAD